MTPGAKRRFFSLCPGRLPYGAALTLQEELVQRRRRGEDDVLILLEHPPVVTLGRSGREGGLRLAAADYARSGIELVHSGRGGDVTYHGPGQLIGYPILDLSVLGRDLHRYLRLLEAVLIETLAAFGVTGERIAGRTGVWVGGAKIASIGIAVRHWISYHGFALNVADDREGFATIVPCGLPGVALTSLEGEVGRTVSRAAVTEVLIDAFSLHFASEHAGLYDPTHPEKTVLA
ncbi:lipoate-protein ligase B [Desulfuromonas soudanensis]|uniref:Octanoyltransferase n=1 Tax=Desulfuromonas soudanensis TaxID=1603606 RepID=A0A0M4DK47_9BACT|nr:lipoate-protein ligase B [Desulfuromonas soudanensis]